MGSTLKGKNLLRRSKFFSLKADPIEKGGKIVELSPLFTLILFIRGILTVADLLDLRF